MLQDRNSRNFSFPAQLGIFLGLTGVGMVIASLLSAAIWISMTHLPLPAMQSEMFNPKYYSEIMILQAVSTLFMMFLPVVFFAMICYRKPWLYTGANSATSWKQFALVAVILILVFPVGGALAELNKVMPLPHKLELKFKAMEETRRAQEAAFININTFSKYIFSIFIIAVLPAIFEEFFFRAGLQNIFMRWFRGPLVAIILTSFIFSIIHISYYGFLVRFALGMILGYIFYYSGSIWLSVFLHFLFNGLQVTAMYALKASNNINSKDVEENFPLWAGIPALIILIIVFQQFKKESVRIQQKFVYKEPDDPNDFHNWIANN